MIYSIILLSMVASIGNLATITGAYNANRLGRPSIAAAGDVNGDGYSDFIYGQKYYIDYPKAYVLFGGRSFDNIPDVTLTYTPPYEGYFGWTVGYAGDVNCDGYDDVMVAKSDVFDPEEKDTTENQEQIQQEIYIYYGGTDMDGQPDITIMDPNPPGSGYQFGGDLCKVDFWFDGQPPDDYPDIVVGCPPKDYLPYRGKVYVFRGPQYQEYVELTNPLPDYGHDALGHSVTVADFNSDGVEEIVAGAPHWNNKGAIVMWSPWMNPVFVESPFPITSLFGFDVASGDVTNDGFPDLYISAPSVLVGSQRRGKVRISYGHEDWGYTGIAIDDQELVISGPYYDYFGWSVAHGGDVNRDEIGDIVVGAHQGGELANEKGFIALYFGGSGAIDNTCDLQIYGEASQDGFGWRVCGTGDMNCDGYADFGVSAPYNDAGDYNAGRVYVYGELSMSSDDALALAYNGNRHLVRKPNTEELHLVYTSDRKIYYTYSTDGGTNWPLPFVIGEGSFPAIALASDNLPSVTWTDDEGGLWYRRKTSSTNWSDIYHLDDPTSPDDRHLNSPPSIAIHPSNPNTVHILVTRSGLISPYEHDYSHTLEDFVFPISYPGQGWFDIIDEKLGPLEPPLRSFPSIARCEVNNSLHATWQRVDTICYAVKPRNDPWIDWGFVFDPEGLQSAHPFVETYGDSVFVVWKNEAVQVIYKGYRHLPDSSFQWQDFSQTSVSSCYPVSASGFFTVYDEEPTSGYPYDAYYKVNPYDDRVNISSTAYNSLYPQSVARFSGVQKYLYTAWLEGDDTPYEVRFRKIQHQIHPDMAYLSSSNGQYTPSPYLVARDSYVGGWQIPVDVGNTVTSYEFPLVPGYAYKAKAVVYHEGSGPWSGRIKIDNSLQIAVTYNANVPETLECWIPPVLYEDSVLTVSFNRISGNFAAIGPIYIYRYEYEGGGGPMSQKSQPMHNASIAVFPNPFTERLNITCQITSQNAATLKLYDVMGRLVKQFDLLANQTRTQVVWDGVDDQGLAVPQGVYFLRVDNPDSGDIMCEKVLRVK